MANRASREPAGYTYDVPVFNPSSEVTQVSRLRLINSGDTAATVTIVSVRRFPAANLCSRRCSKTGYGIFLLLRAGLIGTLFRSGKRCRSFLY